MARRSVTDLDRLLTRALNLLDEYERVAYKNAYRVYIDERQPHIYAVQRLETQRRDLWSAALKANHVHDTTPRDPAIKGN